VAFKSLHLLLACGVAGLVAGCGGAGEAGRATTTLAVTAPGPATDRQADRAIARAALLRPDDFAADWKAGPRPPAPTSSGDCRLTRDATVVQARSPQFAYRAQVEIVEAVAVFPSEDDAERALARQASDKQVACTAGALQRATRKQIPANTAVGEVTAARIEVPSNGERIAAYRYTIPLRQGNASADYHHERVFVRVGRGLVGLGFSTADAGPQQDIREETTRLAAQRLAAALDGNES
jgi:hypothetical protein